MSAEDRFPEELLLNEPNRGRRLVQEFYQQYGNTRQNPAYYTTIGTQHEEIKRAFYRRWLAVNGHDRQNLGLDVGCRGGVLTKMVGLIRWIGVENDADEDDDKRSRGRSHVNHDRCFLGLGSGSTPKTFARLGGQAEQVVAISAI